MYSFSFFPTSEKRFNPIPGFVVCLGGKCVSVTLDSSPMSAPAGSDGSVKYHNKLNIVLDPRWCRVSTHKTGRSIRLKSILTLSAEEASECPLYIIFGKRKPSFKTAHEVPMFFLRRIRYCTEVFITSCTAVISTSI
jgi:hypothetical protein